MPAPVCPLCQRLLATGSLECPSCRAAPAAASAYEYAWEAPRRKRKYEVDDDDFDREAPRRKRKGEFRLPGMWWFVAGIPLSIMALSFLARGSGAGAVMVMLAMALGILVAIAGYLWLLFIVVSDSPGQLLLCLFIPFYSLFYIVSNLDETKRPALMYLIGLLVIALSIGASGIHEKAIQAREQAEKAEKAKQEKQDNPGTPQPGGGQPKNDPPKIGPGKKDDAPKLDPASLDAPYNVDPKAQAAGDKIFLIALEPFAYKAGPWKLGLGGKGPDGKEPIEFDKKRYPSAISMHPPQTGVCRVSFVPGKEFKRFKGWAAVSAGAVPWGTFVCAVWGDEKKLWESEGMMKSGSSAGFDIDITGVKVLVLETRMKSGSYTDAHAVWLDPWLER